MKIVEKQTRMLGQNTPVITFDLQLYIIAQEVKLRNWDKLSHIVLRLGVSISLSCIGRVWENAAYSVVLKIYSLRPKCLGLML